MKNNLNEVIRELSEIYDNDSQDTYITLYLNANALDEKFLERREKDSI